MPTDAKRAPLECQDRESRVEVECNIKGFGRFDTEAKLTGLTSKREKNREESRVRVATSKEAVVACSLCFLVPLVSDGGQGLGQVCLESELDHVLVRAQREVVGDFLLVELGQANLAQVVDNGLGSAGQVVVGNLGEEEVVGNVAVGNVVVQRVDAPAKPTPFKN